jgi:hypothetical protein
MALLTYPTKPTAPAWQAALGVAAGGCWYAPLHEGAGTPGDLVGPTAGTLVSTGTQTGAMSWSTDPTSGWAGLSCTQTIQQVRYVGRGPTVGGSWAVGAILKFNSGDIQPVAAPVGAGWYGPRVRAVSGGMAILYNLITVTLTGAVGHRLLVVVTEPAYDPTVQVWVYDYDTRTPTVAAANTKGVPPTAAAGDIYINPNPGAAYSAWDVTLYGAFAFNAQFGPAHFNALIADPWCLGRAGDVAPDLTYLVAGQPNTVNLSGASEAYPAEVAAKYLTDGLSFAGTMGDPNALGNAPPISGLAVAGEQAASLTITPALGAGPGYYRLQDLTGKRKAARDLYVGPPAGAASSFTVQAPAVLVVGRPSAPWQTAPGPLGGTGSQTITPSDGGAGGVYSPTTVTLGGSYTYTPTRPGAITFSWTNSGVLANPASQAITPILLPISPGSLDFGTMTMSSGLGPRKFDVPILGTAPSGGTQNFLQSWYLPGDPSLLPLQWDAASNTATPSLPSSAYLVPGATGLSLTLAAQDYGREVPVVRIVTDTVTGQWAYTPKAGTFDLYYTFMDAGVCPLRKIWIVIIGDSVEENIGDPAPNFGKFFANAVGNATIATYLWQVVAVRNAAVANRYMADYLPTASNVHPRATAGQNFYNWLLALAHTTGSTADEWYVLSSCGKDAIYLDLGDITQFDRDYQTFAAALRADDPRWKAIVFARAPQAVVGQGGNARADVARFQVQARMDGLVAADRFFQQGDMMLAAYSARYGLAVLSDGIHPGDNVPTEQLQAAGLYRVLTFAPAAVVGGGGGGPRIGSALIGGD